MAKTIILLNESIAIPLVLADKYNKDLEGKSPEFTLNPTGECSDAQADALTKTYPAKYAIYDTKNPIHSNLLTGGKYPEATKVIVTQMDAQFAKLPKAQKLQVIDYMKKLTSVPASQPTKA